MSSLDSGVGSSHRETMKTALIQTLMQQFTRGFYKERTLGQPISGPLLCEKPFQLIKQTTGWKYRLQGYNRLA